MQNNKINRRYYLKHIIVATAVALCAYNAFGFITDEMLEENNKSPGGNSAEIRNTKPLVGAIRWDAWNGSTCPVGVQVERSLSPAHYHFRLPFYSKINQSGGVSINHATQEVMDQEIRYANQAGIDYWAFIWYPEPKEKPSRLATARHLYQSSTINNQVKWCLIFGSAPFDPVNDTPWVIDKMAKPNYLTTQNGRPVIYIFGISRKDREPLALTLQAIRDALKKKNLPAPYIIGMGWNAEDSASALLALGGDALSRYCSGGENGEPYANLMQREQQSWDDFASTGVQVVPWVTTGWDKRPRSENPVSWEPNKVADHAKNWVQQATPAQIGEQLQAALTWNNQKNKKTIFNSVIFYAWNENDEGGWINPTLFELRDSGRPLRLDAIQKVLSKR